MSFEVIEHTTGLFEKFKFDVVYDKMFFILLIDFLVVGDYELPKSTSHILRVPLNLECV